MGSISLVKRAEGQPVNHDRLAVLSVVCDRISAGELVKDVCDELKIAPAQIRQWCADDEQLGALYARARENQAHALAEQAVSIAHGDDALTLLRQDAVDEAEAELRVTEPKTWYQKINGLRAEVINRDRLRVDTLKWMTTKIAPRVYGERQQVDVSGINPVADMLRLAEQRRIEALGETG